MRRLLLGLLWAWAIFWLWVQISLFSHLAWPIRDFTAFYDSGYEWWTQGTLYRTQHPYANLNAPHVTVLLFAPLARLWEFDAAVVWSVLNLLLLVIAAWIIQAELQIPRSRYWWIVALVCASPMMHHQWRQGQLGAILCLLAVLAWRAARHQQVGTTSGWLAGLISVKPWIGLVLVVQSWRVIWRTVALGLAGVLVGVWALGLANWTDWLATMQAHDVWPPPSNTSIYGSVLRYTGHSEYGAAVMFPMRVALLYWPIALLVLIVTALSTWRRRLSRDAQWLIWLLAGVLVSPVGWTYYHFVALAPFLAWGEQEGWPRSVRWLLLPLLLPASLYASLWLAFGNPTIGSIYTFATLGLWLVVILRAKPAKGGVD